VVFGAAVAARTERIRIGFAVVEMAFHHPVRLAAQTALLDNLSRGRLTVGTGRGSAFNHYEYIGFGTTMEEGAARLAEAEDLLVKAWTTENLRYEGEYWQVAFPLLRPRPYQKPHPPLVRACISEDSTMAMARIGRPVLIGVQAVDTMRARLEVYRRAMLGAGFDDSATEKALDQSWVAKNLVVADSYSEARAIAETGFRRERRHFREARERYNPGGIPPPKPGEPARPGEDLDQSFLMGTHKQVADQIAELRDNGVRNLMLKVNTGEMKPAHVHSSMKLFGEKVLPLFA
jgi:alkanesulfonate monooxygenase SsuD/methylene tetrahydromethanopterin reductase-like flavin-dependent oxidoreductase (luciferase family)